MSLYVRRNVFKFIIHANDMPWTISQKYNTSALMRVNDWCLSVLLNMILMTANRLPICVWPYSVEARHTINSIRFLDRSAFDERYELVSTSQRTQKQTRTHTTIWLSSFIYSLRGLLTIKAENEKEVLAQKHCKMALCDLSSLISPGIVLLIGHST